MDVNGDWSDRVPGSMSLAVHCRRKAVQMHANAVRSASFALDSYLFYIFIL